LNVRNRQIGLPDGKTLALPSAAAARLRHTGACQTRLL
jgi:hypothetical protein